MSVMNLPGLAVDDAGLFREYEICHACCDFGASAADFADLLDG